MLEKYATDMLKELDKEKSKGPASPSTQQGAGYSPAGRRPSEWRPSSSGAGYRGYEQGPDYASYPYDYNYQSPEDSSAYGSKDALGKPTSRGAEKTGTSQEQKREQAPSKDPDADIGEAIKALQGKATAALEKMTDNVLKSTDENSPIVRAARFALNDVILACEQVHGTLAKRALAWKSLPQDTQDARLQKIEKEIQKQESVKKLTELARTKLAGAMRAGKSTPIITNLQEYLQAYEKVLDATLTTTGAQKQASDAQQELLAALNKNVDGQSILTHAQAATAPTSEAYKKALQDAFEKTQSFLMAVNKLSTRDKNKAQALLKPREIESWTKALQTGSAHADAHTAALTQELGALG